jgi:hypothetical protein
VSGLKQHLDALYTEQNQHKKKIVMKFMFVMQTLYDILLLGKLSIVEVISNDHGCLIPVITYL